MSPTVLICYYQPDWAPPPKAVLPATLEGPAPSGLGRLRLPDAQQAPGLLWRRDGPL
jgi:hypothetical protein